MITKLAKYWNWKLGWEWVSLTPSLIPRAQIIENNVRTTDQQTNLKISFAFNLKKWVRNFKFVEPES